MKNKITDTSISFAQKMDESDPLKSFKKRFVIPDRDLIYLDGNSLGRLPEATPAAIANLLSDEWGERLIRGWNEGWYRMPELIGKKVSMIIGAAPDEVIVCDTTSIGLFKLAYAALKKQKGRKKIVSDTLNFPSDLYIFEGLIEMFDQVHNLHLVNSKDGISINTQDIIAALDTDTALLSLSHVTFKSAYMYDMKAITRAAHAKGIMVLWDLSHAAGAVPIHLNECEADLAVGCSYKYLNAGPGSPAFIYVRKDLQEKISQPLWGWLGDADPFKFNLSYTPSHNIRQFITSSPPILTMKTMEAGLDIILEAGMDNIREKSRQQSEYLIFLFEKKLYSLGFTLGSPHESHERGSHVTLRHPEAYRINRALIEGLGGRRLIPDFREPDNIRLGITPLYVTFEEIYHGIELIKKITEEKLYEKLPAERLEVT